MNANHIWQNADALDRLLKQEFNMARLAYQVMALLHEVGDLTIGEVAATYCKAGGTMTAAIDRMESAGLAKRIPNPADRRSPKIRLLKPEVYLAARKSIEERTAVLVS